MKTLIPLWVWAIVIGLVFGLIAPNLGAEPLYAADAGGIKIVLHTEKCSLPGVVNLANKATWEEGGKSFDGCWGGHPQIPMVMFYFADKTVVIVPVELFKRLTGT